MTINYPKNRKRKYSLNQDIFKSWSHDMAWLLGLLATDGCLQKDSNVVSLSSSDLEIIEKARQIFDYGGAIMQRDCYIISISSHEIYNDLLVLGLTPAKSLTLEMPNVPQEFLGDFIRGVFDGDGSVSFDKSRVKYERNPRLLVRIVTASEKFFEQLINKMEDVGLNPRKEFRRNRPENRQDIYCIAFCGFNSIQFMNYIYQDSTPSNYMERKKLIFDAYVKEYGALYANGAIRGRTPNAKCIIEGCDNMARYSTGICQSHHMKNYRNIKAGGESWV